MKQILAAALLLSLLQACYYDKEAIIYPQSGYCDTARVTYALVVSPIINNYCLACHSSSAYNSLGGNLNLQGYSNIMVPISSGILLKSIEHNPDASAMPKNSPKLSPCNISKIKEWIDAGAPNN